MKKEMKKEMKKATQLLIGIAAAVVVFSKRKTIIEYSKNKVWDFVSEQNISTLHPMVREAARKFINVADNNGIKLRIVSALRTFAEQDSLYAQGRTKPGQIVTNAKAGQSSHNFGTAIDVVPIVNGKANWNADYNRIAAIGKEIGFSWGGDWISFKDKPHFEMNFGYSLAQLRDKYNTGQLSGGYVQLA
jgi:peptidoglycan L-alanyl-D-glutamate endopeptidase CwlK